MRHSDHSARRSFPWQWQLGNNRQKGSERREEERDSAGRRKSRIGKRPLSRSMPPPTADALERPRKAHVEPVAHHPRM